MTEKLHRVKARFEAEGMSIAEWSRARGFDPKLVYRVLNGDVKGTRGQAHKIACELGLKREPKKLQFRPTADAA
jgi:gp16 family phage-associated protein